MTGGMLTTQDVARRVGISTVTLLRHVRKGDIPARRDRIDRGKRWRYLFNPVDVETWMALRAQDYNAATTLARRKVEDRAKVWTVRRPDRTGAYFGKMGGCLFVRDMEERLGRYCTIERRMT